MVGYTRNKCINLVHNGFDLLANDVKVLYPGNLTLERFHISDKATKSQLFTLSKKSMSLNLSPNVLLDRPFIFHALKDMKETSSRK